MSRDEFRGRILVAGDPPLLSLSDLVQVSRLERDLVVDLIELGVLGPVSPESDQPESWRFPARTVEVVRCAARLREAFDLNVEGLVVALTYRERVRGLEREITRLRCLLGE